MLDVIPEDFKPIMLALLPHREAGTGEIRIVECAQRNRDHVGEVAAAIMHSRPAFGAEMVGRGLTAVGRAGPLLRRAFDVDAIRRPPRLDRERAARALLAVEAMAGGNADRLASRRRL